MNKALFLDRDGIINIDHGYVYKIADFEFVDGVFELCQKASSLGYKIIVITNQAGIARGYYNETDFLILTAWMKAEFEKHNIIITDVFFCPHHPTAGVNEFKMQCNCRKPAPQMILRAQQQYNINIQHSIFIGDKDSDMMAARNAGIEQRILVTSKYQHETLNQTAKVDSVHAAIDYIH